MTEKEFQEWMEVTVPCALFHVEDTTKDDKYGVKLDELILIELISKNPEVLKFKSLDWLVNHFINSYSGKTKRFDIDFFEFSFLVEACIPPVPIARHSFWEDVINKYYYILNQNERDELYKWITDNPRFSTENKHCQIFEARFNPKNQYLVTSKTEEGIIKKHHCFLLEGKYHAGTNKWINEKYIVEIEPKPIN